MLVLLELDDESYADVRNPETSFVLGGGNPLDRECVCCEVCDCPLKWGGHGEPVPDCDPATCTRLVECDPTLCPRFLETCYECGGDFGHDVVSAMCLDGGDLLCPDCFVVRSPREFPHCTEYGGYSLLYAVSQNPGEKLRDDDYAELHCPDCATDAYWNGHTVSEPQSFQEGAPSVCPQCDDVTHADYGNPECEDCSVPGKCECHHTPETTYQLDFGNGYGNRSAATRYSAAWLVGYYARNHGPVGGPVCIKRSDDGGETWRVVVWPSVVLPVVPND